MVCLFHGDYGPPDPAFAGFALSSAGHSWNVEPRLLKEARNIGEAEAIERHVLHGESVSWCRSGYGWVEQDAITWFYVAALSSWCCLIWPPNSGPGRALAPFVYQTILERSERCIGFTSFPTAPPFRSCAAALLA